MTKNLLSLHSLDDLLEMNIQKHKMKKMTTKDVKNFMKEMTSNEITREISEKEYIKIVKNEPDFYNRYQHSAYFMFDSDDGIYRYFKRTYKNKKEDKQKCQKNY